MVEEIGKIERIKKKERDSKRVVERIVEKMEEGNENNMMIFHGRG